MTDPLETLRAALAGRYTVERELGRGGMATVYLAHDLRHDRPVAIKVLHPELSASLGPERFLREIRTTARLDHPHILPLLESGEAASDAAPRGLLWYAMPYVEGESLRDRLRREGQLPLDQALRIAGEVAEALDCAHEHGVIHRDVKPDNILLTRGRARVADFGVARALEAAGAETGLTETGLAVGTPTYMSPEQATGGTVDRRSDVYALGCVLYEMLAGEPPFTGPTAQAAIARRMSGEVPPLRAARPTVPETVEQIVRKALAAVPADRFPSAADLAHALGSAATTTASVVAAPRAGRRLPGRAAALAAGFILGLGVLFGWLRSGQGRAAGGEVQRLAVLPFENLGRPEDDYFADGLTDAVRGKLAAVPRLQVAARASSSRYKGTGKTPQEIGRELGVQYLLTGTVRWDKAGGQGRIQVSPELVLVETASTRWQQPFDAALTDVFQVQADVAARVAQALGVELGGGERERLLARPTENLAAYDLYLRGKEYYDRGYDREDLRSACRMYERAIALDSGFALAWANLAESRAAEYWFFYDRTDTALAGAKAAADRALQLEPDLPEGHRALAYYHYWGALDYEAALRELAVAEARRPDDPDLIFTMAAVHRRQGNWDKALAGFRRAVELDPVSNLAHFNLSETYSLLHDYTRSLQELDQVLELAPDWGLPYFVKAQELLHAGADRQEIEQALKAGVERVGLGAIAEAASGNWATGGSATTPAFLLTTSPGYREQLGELTLRPSGDSAGYYQLKAELYRHQPRADLARVYLDSARAVLEAKVAARPEEPAYHVRLGLVYAYLGRKDEAIREGMLGVSQLPLSREAYRGASYLAALALIETLTGRSDAAVDRLERLLAIPSTVSKPLLRLDPAWAPLREHPRFRRLTNSASRTEER